MPERKITATRLRNAMLIDIPDDSLVSRAELEPTCRAIEDLIREEDAQTFMVSMERVKHMSSSFIGQIVAMSKLAESKGATLILTNVNPQVHQVFEMTHLNRSIQIFRKGEKIKKPEPKANLLGDSLVRKVLSIVAGLIVFLTAMWFGMWLMG